MATSNNIITFRRHDLDNLRTFLTGLVTVHHTALAYGGVGGWPFKSAAFANQSALLLGFNAFNQSFFMGLFFWVSGRVSAQSLSRSTPWQFVKNKIIRLGLPAVVYTLAVAPAVRIMVLPRWEISTLQDCLAQYWLRITGVRGPIWYTATLLAFDTVAASTVLALKYLGNQRTKRKHRSDSLTFQRLSKWGWVIAAVCSLLARMHFKLDTVVPIIDLQPAYASQYIYAYSLGYMSYRDDEPRMIGPLDASRVKQSQADDGREIMTVTHTNRVHLCTAIMLSLLSFSLLFLPRYLDTPNWIPETMEQVFSGWTLPGFLYALWNEFSFVVVGPALMAYFQDHQNEAATWKTFSPRYSYVAFLLHTPISIAIELLADRLLLSTSSMNSWMKSQVWQTLGPLVMTLSVGIPSAWASFFVGGKVLEWLPGLKRIL